MAVSSSLLPEFNIPAALDWQERQRNCEHALSLGLPRLQVRYPLPGYLTIACYGPSLRDTYRDMRGPILSVSGAHDFLLGKGVIPKYHVECDPRAHKAAMLNKANDQTEYVIASCCHPDVFSALAGRRVLLWHCDNGPESRKWAWENDPAGQCISGGSNVGLRSFEIAHALGYRAIELHGMDCSFDGSNQWAGAHSGKPKKAGYMRIAGEMRTFLTDPLMVQAAREAVDYWRTHDIPMKVKGSGLMQAMLRKSMAGQAKPWPKRKPTEQQPVILPTQVKWGALIPGA